jgi:anti-anti-sigma factor
MNVKIDTKEKFVVITPAESILSENMTEEFSQLLLSHLKKEIKNIVLSLKNITKLDDAAATAILEVQQEFYDQQQSFVVCDISPEVEQFLDESEILDLLNYTPTESEAWDIVQMEEIERDILGTE